MAVAHRRLTLRSLACVAVAAACVVAFGSAPRAGADEPPVPAPTPAPPPPPLPAPAPKPVEPPRNDDWAVPDVLRQLSRLSGVSITWSDQDKGVMARKILNAGSVFQTNPEQLFDAVRALLANEEVLLVPYGPAPSRMYRAVDMRMLQSQIVLRAQPDVIEVTDENVDALLGQGGRFVSTTIRLRNVTELREVRAALQRLVTQNNVGSVQEVPALRSLVVTDFAPSVAAIYRVVRQLDVPLPPALSAEVGRMALSSFTLSHARAQTVAALLQQLCPQKAVGTPVPPRPAAEAPSPGAPSTSTPRIAFDEVTNQVFVFASAEDTAWIREVIGRVDVLTIPPK